MKKLIIFTIVWLTSWVLFAQDCGFVPTQKSLEYTKSMASNAVAYDANSALPISIPVVVNLVRNTAGTVGVSVDTFMEEFEKANDKFLGSGLQFFVCQEINIINSDEFYLMSPSEQSTIALQNDIDDVINIYVAQTLTTNGGGSLCGFAYFPNGPERLYITNGCLLNGSTLPHELGHFFGLQHTHGESNATNSTEELADGSNGLTTGDYIVDTPSDPNLNGLVNTACEYSGNYLDANGQLHRPDVNNLMSYSKKNCREYFTQGQMDLMYSVALDSRSNLQCSDFSISFVSSNPVECNLPLTIDFEDCSVGSVLTEWDIDNDGTIDYTGENVSHTYTETGTYDIAMRITNAEGDVISKVYEGYVVAGGVDVNTQLVTLELKLDNWPSETSWKLINSSDEVVYEGGGYKEGQDDNDIFTYDFYVYPEGCYEFIIEDVYGDGICCTTGAGYYKLIDDSGNVFDEGGDFNEIDYSYFNVVDNTLSNGNNTIQKFTVTPNPFNDYINLSSKVEYKLFDLTGKVLLLGNNNSIRTSSLPKGIYLLKIGQDVYKIVK